MDFSREELEKEVIAIGESIKAHEDQMKLHIYAVRVDAFIKQLFEKELKKLPKNDTAPKEKKIPTGVG